MKGKVFLIIAVLFAIVAVLARFYPFDRTPPSVSISPAPGPYNEIVTVELSTEKGARVYFSLGEAEPMPYLRPFPLREDVEISYYSVDRAGNRSDIQSAAYRIRLDTTPPVTTARPRGGKYQHPVSVRLQTEDGAVVRFTLDGTTPGDGSSRYEGPIVLKKNAVLKFFAVDAAGNREKVQQESYRINLDTTKPVTVANPSGGLYNTPVTVTLSGEKGTRIFYTLDGKRPSTGSKRYSEPITFDRSGVIRFFALDEAGNRENTREERYVIDRDPPRVEAQPAGGTFGKPVSVALRASERGEIRYEVDGREPGISSPLYRGPIEVARNSLVKFYAVDQAGNRSRTSTEEYLIDTEPPAVVARPVGGNYSGRIRVKLETSEPATVYFTVDGTRPTENSEQYRGPVNVAKNLVLSYLAVDTVGNRSEVVSQRYVLDSVAPRTDADPPGGAFTGPILVALKTEEGAVTRYTTDGSTPGLTSPVYSGSIRIARETVLKYFSTDESGNREAVRVERYSFDTKAPSTAIDPPPGVYRRPISVSMSSEKGGKIFFRRDGEDQFRQYSGPFVIEAGGTVLFYSEDQTGNREAVQMAEYVIDTEPPNTIPYPAPGEYNPPVALELRSEKGAKIYYSLDGKDPTEASPQYVTPLAFRENVTIRFFAVDEAGNREKVRTANYRVASGLWRNNSNGVFIHPSVLDGDYLWVGGEEGLFRVNIINKRRRNFTSASSGLISNSVRAIAVDRLGFKWIGTDRGVSQFDGKSTWVTYDYGDGLPSNVINCIVIDKDERIWFGTDSGLARYDGKTFKTFTESDGLPDNNVNSLAIDADGVFWIGTDGGLVRYHGKMDRVFTRSDGLPSDRILSVAVDGRWNIWVGTGGDGVARFDRSRWTRFGTSEGFPGKDIPVIAVDLADNKWFHSEQGVLKYDGNRFTPVKMPIYR
ncbi:MAG: chitobiase/beta-hexosaminidase C-terminal domain-containing protein [bacterium]|nr:MAG: chitobiase/beta-hexosaminidase C-terminal domain-containing protein [bacterium]